MATRAEITTKYAKAYTKAAKKTKGADPVAGWTMLRKIHNNAYVHIRGGMATAGSRETRN